MKPDPPIQSCQIQPSYGNILIRVALLARVLCSGPTDWLGCQIKKLKFFIYLFTYLFVYLFLFYFIFFFLSKKSDLFDLNQIFFI